MTKGGLLTQNISIVIRIITKHTQHSYLNIKTNSINYKLS